MIMKSKKQKIFQEFEQGLRPSQVKRRGLKKQTLYRYFQEWKKKKARTKRVLSREESIEILKKIATKIATQIEQRK